MIRLIPREDSFFEMFEQQVKTVSRAAHNLEEMMNNFSKAKAEDLAFQIKATEHDGDEIVHQIMRKLNMTFVTPLDREDIHALTSALDDILDYIEAAADRMVMYEVNAPTESAVKLVQILAEASDLTVKAVSHLRDMKHPKDMRELCIAVNRLENQGDQVNREALAKLFRMHDQPMEALKWREIYDHIETAIDKCEDVADILESTLLKNS